MPISKPRTPRQWIAAARVLLAAGTNRGFWLSRGAELLGQWVFLVALIVLVYRLTEDIAIVAAFMLARLTPRAIVIAFCEPLVARLSTRALAGIDLVRAALIASLVFVSSRDDLLWASAVVLALGFCSAAVDSARVALLPGVVSPLRLGAANALNARIERVSFVISPLLGAAVLWLWNVDAAFLLHTGALTLSALLLAVASARIPADAPLRRQQSATLSVHSVERLRRRPALAVLAGGLFTGAAVAISLQVSLVALVSNTFEGSDSTLGLLLAAVGFGTIAGPAPIPRVLGRFPASFVVAGSAWVLAVILAFITRTESLLIAAILLVIIGLISITTDMLAATATRRLTPEDELAETTRMMVVAVAVGQVVATVVIVALTPFWDITTVVLLIGIAGALTVSGLLVVGDGKAIGEGLNAVPGARRLARR